MYLNKFSQFASLCNFFLFYLNWQSFEFGNQIRKENAEEMLKVPKISYLQLMDVQTMCIRERRLRWVMNVCVCVCVCTRENERVYVCMFVCGRGTEIESESEKVMGSNWVRNWQSKILKHGYELSLSHCFSLSHTHKQSDTKTH